MILIHYSKQFKSFFTFIPYGIKVKTSQKASRELEMLLEFLVPFDDINQHDFAIFL